jgi:hypothetical protein
MSDPISYTPETLPLPVGRTAKYRIAQAIGARVGRRLLVSADALKAWLATPGSKLPAITKPTK